MYRNTVCNICGFHFRKVDPNDEPVCDECFVSVLRNMVNHEEAADAGRLKRMLRLYEDRDRRIRTIQRTLNGRDNARPIRAS